MNTPPRSVRVPDHIWDAARARAQAEGTTVTAVILRALTRYAKGAPQMTPQEAFDKGWAAAMELVNED